MMTSQPQFAAQTAIKRLLVVDRRLIEHQKVGEPFSLISITDQCFGTAELSHQEFFMRDLLRISFADYDLRDNSGWDDWADSKGILLSEKAMNHGHADRIWRFVRDCSTDLLAVHCEAGVSRSPSTAFAISDCLGIPRENIDWQTGRDVMSLPPNQHVYELLIESFYGIC